MKHRILLLLTIIFTLGVKEAAAQGWTVKTNVAGWAALAPNLGVDLCMNECSSLEAIFYQSATDCWIKNANFTAVQFGYKYWFDRTPLNSFFLGVTATPAKYKVKINDTNRKGYALPFGVNIGYCYPLNDRWNFEFSYGIGATYFFEDIYDFVDVGGIKQKELIKSRRRTVLTPSNIGINISYIIK